MEDFLNLTFRRVIKSSTATYTSLQKLGVGGTAETYLVLASSGLLRRQIFALKIFRRLSTPECQAK